MSRDREDAEAWHRCVETMMTMAGLSCALSPSESMVEFQRWLSTKPVPSGAGMRDALEKIAYWPKKPDADWVKADAWRLIAINALQPCGECHLQPEEICDICGRRGLALTSHHHNPEET